MPVRWTIRKNQAAGNWCASFGYKDIRGVGFIRLGQLKVPNSGEPEFGRHGAAYDCVFVWCRERRLCPPYK